MVAPANRTGDSFPRADRSGGATTSGETTDSRRITSGANPVTRVMRWSADRGWGGGPWPHAVGGPWAHAPGSPGPRSLALHAVFAVAAGLIMTLGTNGSSKFQPDRQDIDVVAIGLIAFMALGLLFRRVAPLAGLALTAVATAAYFALAYPAGAVFFAICFLMVEVALWLPTSTSLIACSLAVSAVVGAEIVGRLADGRSLSGVAPYLGWLLVPWAAGAVKRAWRDGRAAHRAELVQQRRYEERLAVVREVHDVVGHGLAVINLQAGVALHVLDRRPEQAEIALTAIKQASKDSLDELRATLAVFRNADPSAEAPLRPTPGLSDLPELLATVGIGGLAAELHTAGVVRTAPSTVDLAAYRIVQESLTNVVRHARAQRVDVTVSYLPDAISIEVVDDGVGPAPGPDGGQGIVGMRERATSLGGSLSAGAGTGGGFAVRALLPLLPPTDPTQPEDVRLLREDAEALGAERISGSTR